MRARLLRVLFLLFFAAMFAVYAVSIATSAPRVDVQDTLQVIEQWC